MEYNMNFSSISYGVDERNKKVCLLIPEPMVVKPEDAATILKEAGETGTIEVRFLVKR